jgi:hypothetical protein
MQQGAKRATGGSTEFTTSHDLSFGLTLDVAKIVGIETSWLSSQRLSVNVQFATDRDKITIDANP